MLDAKAYRNVATERVAAIANFAHDMVHWLHRFADAMAKYRTDDDYLHARQHSAGRRIVAPFRAD